MYIVTINAKIAEEKRIILRQRLKTKRECELYIMSASEIIEVVDYSITKTK